ncbi:hypothetical protein M0811_09320 [Anaeramoeba ignava]|uniref:Fibronectin type-III domain-containing protein n=1 Tax=Anaeramoeba ignava TaxID=1746090 RepID=A0A9Q0LI74_ANAIG|nr:hypothetical protein M0811_09320 [Anaeramoeba ignava]
MNSKKVLFFSNIFLVFFIFEVLSLKEAKINEKKTEGKEIGWVIKQTLKENETNTTDQFSWGLSVSENKEYLVIGSPFAKIGNNSFQGKVYIYKFNGTNWNLFQILIANDGNQNDNFGSSISITQNGTYIFIGSPYAKIGENANQGKVYVYEFNGKIGIFYIFENNGTNWNLFQILIANDGNQNDNFGSSISITQNGTYIFIGSPYAKIGENANQGKVYVYEFNGKNWDVFQMINGSDGKDNDQFGISLSTSENQGYVVIGAPYASVGENPYQGKAYIFENNGTNWIESQILFASDGTTNGYFGYDVSISQNTGYLLIGSPTANVGDDWFQGKVYGFENNATKWLESQILIGNDLGWGHFGQTLSISSDGNDVVIGAPFATIGENCFQGEAFFFSYVPKPPQVDILNCSSLFCSFECYWNQVNPSSDEIEYQINYTLSPNWQLIESPILDENVLFQMFNSSNYENITGNVEYSIQIRACNKTTQICGFASKEVNLTTRIDSVKNFHLQAISGEVIQTSWTFPDVPIINSTPKLDHYVLSYQKENSNDSIKTNIWVVNSSTSCRIHNLQSLTNYSVSIYACRKDECFGEDEGQTISSSIETFFSSVINFSCSVSDLQDIFCNWKKPSDSTNSSYYNFTYKAISKNDSATFSINYTSFNFRAQYPDQEYRITVSACDENDNCGTISSIQLETQKKISSNSKTTKIVVGVVVPVVVITAIILIIILVRKRKKKIPPYFDEIDGDYFD